jgi:hypothetical protein
MKKLATTVFFATSYFGLSSSESIKTLFGSKKETNSNESKSTSTYIWGNGIYQARPDAIMRFKNFEPKHIDNLSGPRNINFKDLSFGEYHEGGITTDGKVYIWRKHVLDSSQPNGDNTRENVVCIDSGKDNK